MKAYKILKKQDNGDLTSYVYARYQDKYAKGNGIVYNQIGWSYPEHGKLFVFEKILDAVSFLERDCGLVKNNYKDSTYLLYEVESGDFFEKAKFMAPSSYYDDVINFWKYNEWEFPVPPGTFYTEKLKLVRKIAEFYS